MVKLSRNANYGNWVSVTFMRLLWTVTVVLAAAAVLTLRLLPTRVPGIVLVVLAVLSLCLTVYMQICRGMLDFRRGGAMGRVHQFLVDHFPWEASRKAGGAGDGSGVILDIGCGSGALTNRCALSFPEAKLVGIDYWGAGWSYAKEQCEENARIEGTAERVAFQKGDAAKLDFEDETFDGAVSNFVFHEVRTEPDKRKVVREALRVVKRGGAFAFQDLFSQKKLYGEMGDFVRELQRDGTVREIYYIADIEKKNLVPKFVTAPWMITGAGLIYGIR